MICNLPCGAHWKDNPKPNVQISVPQSLSNTCSADLISNIFLHGTHVKNYYSCRNMRYEPVRIKLTQGQVYNSEPACNLINPRKL